MSFHEECRKCHNKGRKVVPITAKVVKACAATWVLGGVEKEEDMGGKPQGYNRRRP